MMSGRIPNMPEDPLGLSWHDSNLIPILNASNVLDYFSSETNRFYDRTCNNTLIKMQRLNPDQLVNMTGIEYKLLHVQEPILYVIRKLHRYSQTQVTPIADYYISAGIVYQAPDLASVINSRLVTAVSHLQSAFDDLFNLTTYHPSKGYSWDTKTPLTVQPVSTISSKKEVKEEPCSNFQRHRVDMLLAELTRTYPFPTVQPQPNEQDETNSEVQTAAAIKSEQKVDQEPKDDRQDQIITTTNTVMKPPPEKKIKISH